MYVLDLILYFSSLFIDLFFPVMDKYHTFLRFYENAMVFMKYLSI